MSMTKRVLLVLALSLTGAVGGYSARVLAADGCTACGDDCACGSACPCSAH